MLLRRPIRLVLVVLLALLTTRAVPAQGLKAPSAEDLDKIKGAIAKGKPLYKAWGETHKKVVAVQKDITAAAGNPSQTLVTQYNDALQAEQQAADALYAARTETIHLTQRAFGLSPPGTTGVYYDKMLPADANTESAATVQIGERAFGDPNFLAAVIFHEYEHVDQFANGGFWQFKDGKFSQYTGEVATFGAVDAQTLSINEYLAYDAEIRNATVLGISPQQLENAQKKQAQEFNKLSDANQVWVKGVPGSTVAKTVDDIGRTTVTRTDSSGRPIEVRLFDRNGTLISDKRTAYHANGKIAMTDEAYTDSVGGGSRRTLQYDDQQREIREESVRFQNGTLNWGVDISTAYDAKGVSHWTKATKWNGKIWDNLLRKDYVPPKAADAEPATPPDKPNGSGMNPYLNDPLRTKTGQTLQHLFADSLGGTLAVVGFSPGGPGKITEADGSFGTGRLSAFSGDILDGVCGSLALPAGNPSCEASARACAEFATWRDCVRGVVAEDWLPPGTYGYLPGFTGSGWPVANVLGSGVGAPVTDGPVPQLMVVTIAVRVIRPPVNEPRTIAPRSVSTAPPAAGALGALNVLMRPATFTLERLAQSTLPLAATPTVTLVATGRSQGDAFEMQLGGVGGAGSIVIPNTLVLEPTTATARVMTSSAPGTLVSGVTGFCLTEAKAPPAAGMVYRVADRAVQARFASLGDVTRASRELAARGRLHPDSDAKAYADAVTQWALWSVVEKWNQSAFEQHMTDRAKKNVAAIHQAWTNEMDAALTTAVRNRWQDVRAVLAEAERMHAP